MADSKWPTAALLLLVVLCSSASVAWAATCSDLGGTCMDYKECPSKTVRNLCPGASNIRCCFEGQGTSCSVPPGPGVCLVEGYQKCTGTFFTGFCPGPAAVKCCAGTGGSAPTPPKVPPSPPPKKPVVKDCAYWGKLVKIPATKNTGLTSVKPSALKKFFGQPCSNPDTACANQGVPARLRKNLISTSEYPSIPFKVTILKPYAQALARIFTKVKADDPSLYAVISARGSHCCRGVKKASGAVLSTLSVHSWAAAVDLSLCTLEPSFGAGGKTYRAIVALAPYFEAERLYWGAAFKDAMHFELSGSLLADWISSGALVK